MSIEHSSRPALQISTERVGCVVEVEVFQLFVDVFHLTFQHVDGIVIAVAFVFRLAFGSGGQIFLDFGSNLLADLLD